MNVTRTRIETLGIDVSQLGFGCMRFPTVDGKIDEALAERQKRWELYNQELETIEGIEIFATTNEASRNYAYFPILVGDEYKITRDEIYDLLKENNIYSRKYFYPLTSDAECFKGQYQDALLPNARMVAEHILVLPLYPELEYSDVEKICTIIRRTIKAE